MGTVESQILRRSVLKPLVWKRFIDDIFSIWNINKDEVTQFIEQANSHHHTFKFTAEVSDKDTTFLDTNIYKGEGFANESILDIKRISNQLKHFNTRISQVATHQGSKRASLKAKHLGFSGQTPQKLRSKLQFQTLKHISRKEGTPKL